MISARSGTSRAIQLGWFGVMALGAGYLHAQAQAPSGPVSRPAGLASSTAVSPRVVLDTYCVSCHNERLKTAGLRLDTMDVDHVGNAADVWEKVARKFRTHEMPPPGRPRPDRDTYSAVAARIETALDTAAAAKPNPGRVAVHRLNRIEYTNAVRDLLGLEVDGRQLLPADDSNQESFDNMASVLSVSPVLLEGYLSAASRVSRLAVGDPAMAPVVDTYQIPKALVQS